MGIVYSGPSSAAPSDAPYDSATWNGSLDAATKNAIRDEIEILITSIAGKVDSDSDLSAIAALTPSNDDIIQRKVGAWTNRTVAQYKADLALNLVDNTSDASKPVSTAQAAADALNLKIASNLSDLNSAPSARTNLGLGTLATQSGTFSGTSSGTNTGDQIALTVANTPAGNIAATTVQAAINELDSEKQPLDSDLTTIAGLTPTTDNFMQAKASAWASRTIAQVKTDLAIDAINNTSDVNKPLSELELLAKFGNGADGDVTISAGTTTLTRDMFYNNLTINGSGVINTIGYKIYVKGILDITAAPAGAISRPTSSGGNGAAGAAGPAGNSQSAATIGGATAGGIGIAGTTGAGGTGTTSANSTSAAGGRAGAGGSGGAPALAAGGTAGTAPTVGTFVFGRAMQDFLRGSTVIAGSVGGSSGGAGTGDGSNNAGGSGGGGGGAGCIAIYARTISRDSSTTAAAAIRALGSAGGNGGTTAGGNSGGGGGSGGSGGGFVYIEYYALTGSTKTGLIDVSGGTGGNGGAGTGTGRGGQGGQGGAGGRVLLINAASGAITQSESTTTLGSTPSTPGTTAGSTGTAGTTLVVDL